MKREKERNQRRDRLNKYVSLIKRHLRKQTQRGLKQESKLMGEDCIGGEDR
jgi:hypothetical protein